MKIYHSEEALREAFIKKMRIFCINEMMSVKNASYVTFVLNNTMKKIIRKKTKTLQSFTLQMKDFTFLYLCFYNGDSQRDLFQLLKA